MEALLVIGVFIVLLIWNIVMFQETSRRNRRDQEQGVSMREGD